MSSALSIVRKDLREHRAVLLAIAILIPLLTAAALLATDLGLARNAALPWILAAVAVFAVSLTVAPNLIPSESGGNGLRFLGRLPIAPNTILGAKAAFLLMTAAGAALYGLSVGTVALACLGRIAMPELTASNAFMALAPLFVALWLVSVSCWIPRPLAVIPATAVVMAVLGGPVYLILNAPLLRLTSHARDGIAIVATAAPILATWIAWSGGLARYGNPRVARGIAAFAMCALPVWGWAAWQRHEHEIIDVRAQDVDFPRVLVGANGTRAYLVANRRHAVTYAIAADLLTGRWEQTGPPGSGYTTLPDFELSGLAWGLTSHAFVVFHDADTMSLIDTATGASRTLPTVEHPRQTMPEELQADLRVSTPLRDAEGRRILVLRDRIEREAQDGSMSTCASWPDKARFVSPFNGGLQFWSPGAVSMEPVAFFELLSARMLSLPARPADWTKLMPWPGGWVAKSKGSADWILLERDTGTARPAMGLSTGDDVVCALDDHRLLVRPVIVESPESALAIRDPRTGQTEPVRDEHGIPVSCTRLEHPLYCGALPLRTQAGNWVFAVEHGGAVSLTRLDRLTGTMSFAHGLAVPRSSWDVEPLLCEGDRSVLVLNGHKRIERVVFGSDERQVLFPRAPR